LHLGEESSFLVKKGERLPLAHVQASNSETYRKSACPVRFLNDVAAFGQMGKRE
jgi:hypothetical protein